MADFTKEILKFPVSFDIKVIMGMKEGLEENRKRLLCVLNGLKIPHFEWRTRFSVERNYVSFSVNIVLDNQELMDRLYSELKKDSNIRFAV